MRPSRPNSVSGELLLFLQGQCLWALERRQEAVDCLEEHTEHAPADVVPKETLVSYLEELGEHAWARQVRNSLPCPHCGSIEADYRELTGGFLACSVCGQSHPSGRGVSAEAD